MNRNFNLLLVEDNPGDADWVRERLSEISDYDYRINHVGTVRDADAVLQAGHVDAILLDLNLPDSRGRDTLEWARRVSDKVAVTVLTGTDDENLRLSAYDEGANDYVVKGGTQAKLLSSIISFGIERQRAKLQQKQLERIVAALPDAVIVADRDGAVDFVNDAAVSLFGRTRDELVAERLGFPVQEGSIGELEIQRPDGRRYAEGNIVPFMLHDRPLFLAVIRDVTEKKKISEHLRETQKLEAIGTLAGGIAHDFNNLLALIAGNVKLALEEQDVSPSLRENLEEIDSAAARASELVRQILTFSRREETELRVVQPEGPVREAVRFLHATIPDRIAVHLDVAPDLPSIKADSTQVQQVVMNLATNAVHAMPQGNGSLEITLDLETIPRPTSGQPVDLPPGKYVRLSVRDSGVGMEPGTQARVFEPFFTTKLKGEGTGLGLAVVHGIVRRHEGAISVESEPGKGSTFHVLFPVQDAGEEKTSAAPQAGRRGCGQRVLFVDDERQLVLLARRILERLNYRVEGFEDPREALASFRTDPDRFDVVITDLSMPGMDGRELIREIQAIRSGIPILLTTGFIRSEDTAMIRELGVFDVIVKPAALVELGEILQRVLGSKS